jgi:hypothetical protein
MADGFQWALVLAVGVWKMPKDGRESPDGCLPAGTGRNNTLDSYATGTETRFRQCNTRLYIAIKRNLSFHLPM